MLKKTIEKNPKDMESYKLLVQILIKEDKIEEALEILTKETEKTQNADMYYLMSKIFESMEDDSSRLDCLELALENRSSLTFDENAVKVEYKELKKKIA